jgi:hypothetical protein
MVWPRESLHVCYTRPFIYAEEVVWKSAVLWEAARSFAFQTIKLVGQIEIRLLFLHTVSNATEFAECLNT